ncbi:hypothetical protein BOTBODRAFT_638487 [Botryobasidium botryosum FD-172 SS1]|uniref:Uncharacterized protein n=1 Tax=Botryobasidium botryosum (strain FD-172 SS1) TaxID=930990 RepID=A0A067M848_BOTB1|nr:hypothetical protein BOTBODRAFT_638487 [Botryobasidium botryosum FD-172 SS1]
MATCSRSIQSLSTPFSPLETPSTPQRKIVSQRRTSGFRRKVGEKMEARRKEKALYNISTRSLSSSATFPVQRPSRASLSPSPQKSARVVLVDRTNLPALAPPVKTTTEKPAAPQSLPARSTVYVAAENNAAGICILIQSPTLVNVKDLWVEELPGDIALLAVSETPVHWAQLRAKGAQTAHACAKAHLAALRKEPDVEAQKRRVIARVEAKRTARPSASTAAFVVWLICPPRDPLLPLRPRRILVPDQLWAHKRTFSMTSGYLFVTPVAAYIIECRTTLHFGAVAVSVMGTLVLFEAL